MVQASDRMAGEDILADRPPTPADSTTTQGDVSTTQLMDHVPSAVASTEVRQASVEVRQ